MGRIDGHRRLGLVVLGLLAAAAGLERWLTTLRPWAPEQRIGARFFVTSPNDAGPGSLREAIFAADRSIERAVIVMRSDHVTLKSPLPPLVNPKGVVIDAQEARSEIDARGVVGAPVLEVRSPNSLVEGLKIRKAAGMAVLVRARGVRLRDVEITDSAEGVTLAEGASDVVVEGSRFERNGTGITVPPDSPNVAIRSSHFAHHDQAAVWAVSPQASGSSEGLVVSNNQFEDDRISVVLIHRAARIERNEFRRAREAAVYVMGDGAVVRGNRTREGAGLGIFADETQGVLIEQNELDHNAAVGIIVRSGGGTVVQRNRVYENGYGIAMVFGEKARPNLVADNLLFAQTQDAVFIVGGSPLVRDNRALQNRVAGLRILDFVPREGPRLAAEPLLQDNVLQNNSLDAPVRGEYRPPPAEEPVR
jgi:parallel beta-helix repeat protein